MQKLNFGHTLKAQRRSSQGPQQRERKKGPAGQVFQATAKVEGFVRVRNKQICHGPGRRGETGGVRRRKGGSMKLSREPPETSPRASRGLQGPPGARRGGPRGRAGKPIFDPHRARNAPSCGMERRTVTQNTERGRFGKSPPRNLPEQGPILRRFPGASTTFRGPEGSFALQGRLHPAKEKRTKEEGQEKKTELHRKQRKRKKGRAGQVFQAINSEGGGFERTQRNTPEHKTGRYVPGRE